MDVRETNQQEKTSDLTHNYYFSDSTFQRYHRSGHGKNKNKFSMKRKATQILKLLKPAGTGIFQVRY